MAMLMAFIFSPIVAFTYQTTWNGKPVDISTPVHGSATSEIVRGKGLFYGIVVRTDGANDVTLNVYDGTSSSGKRLTTPDIVIKGSSFQSGWAINMDPAITYDSGIYVSVSVAGGGTCAYTVLFHAFQ